MLALLLAGAMPQTAVDAERAFAAAAQADGQWTAFRRFAADDAVMFTPEPVDAQTFLRPLKDPPKAILWSPAASYVSCDGRVAANTGPWRRPDGAIGYFSTIWVRQADGGWKWRVDGGDELSSQRKGGTTKVKVRHASCRGKPPSEPKSAADTAIAGIVAEAIGGASPAGTTSGSGASPDGTLSWSYVVQPDGARAFDVLLWSGKRYEPVIADRIAAPSAGK